MSSQFAFSEISRRSFGPKKKDGEAVGAAAKFVGFAVPGTTYSKLKPKHVIVRQLDFKFDGNGLSLFYPQQGTKDPAPQNDAAKKNLLPQYNSKNFPGKRPSLPWDIDDNEETSLSIDTEDACLVILKIGGRANFQFNRNGSPISCDWQEISNFGEIGKLDENGKVIVAKSVSENGNPVDGCRTAYFVVTGRKGKKRLSFNIHLDLIGEKSDGSNYYIPIIIDPDVRHPGGGPD